ncbi:MAG: hypothetical protein E8D46_15655 [Nitrospira sp.]|nr:MAG: hypothetical protein E8D46_15655 [Nitrospira sp.]
MNNYAVMGALGLLLVLWLTGCAYNHKQFPAIVPSSTAPDDFVIQIDDHGQFWDNSVPNRALERISELSQTSNVIVLLFVHGWHHDAAPDNQNLRDFAASVADTRRRLIDISNPESAVYRQSRKALTGSESLSVVSIYVVSIYVGWRGRSLPGFLDYATFWSRKAAAERVGEGDLREFLSRLNTLYREKRDQRAFGTTDLFMGLTSFGHSFGGQVLFRSVAYEIERELLALHAKTDTSRKLNEITGLIGFGDLVVLINPAFEALQFERIWRLSTSLPFGRQQNPVMLVVSSAGDVPRQVLFPIGRNLDALFLRPDFRPGQRALWTQALGEYEPFRTHSIEIVSDSSQLTPGFDPSLYTSAPCAIENLDLTNLPSIAGVRLTPTENHRSNSPFLIAHASVSVVLDHTTVFEETLRKFLNDYIAITQGKRMLTARSSRECM